MLLAQLLVLLLIAWNALTRASAAFWIPARRFSEVQRPTRYALLTATTALAVAFAERVFCVLDGCGEVIEMGRV